MKQGLCQTINEHRIVFLTFAMSVLFICLNLYNRILGIAAFLLHILLLCTVAPSEFAILLYSLMPWAYVYKISGIGRASSGSAM